MAITRAKTWSANEILTASDLNGEFNNIINNATSLVTPFTDNADLNGNELILDVGGDTTLAADTNDRIDLRLGGVDLFRFDGTTASSVNGLDFKGSATTVSPSIEAVGSDTNVDITLTPKAAGSVVLSGQADASVVLAAQIFS